MDAVKAKELEEKLLHRSVGGWTVIGYVNHGKSAAVFRAEKDGNTYALKIFDDELIERYGDKTQLARIERELTLVGKTHPNMVGIRGGGKDPITQNHYIVMDYLDGPNLKECLLDVPMSQVGSLIAQLASAAQFLEFNCLAHRDIKPENIILLNDYTQLKLLDFGVLRPIGQPGLTDDDGIQSFVGTLQYSSPEFLLRNEEDTLDGWRALTLYQIGAVLHDLIMRKPLFADQVQPYARLVNAVQQTVPLVQNPSAPGYLIETARMALSKDPKVRLRLLTWDSFQQPPTPVDPAASARDRVKHRSSLAQAPVSQPITPARKAAEVQESVISAIKVAARSIRAASEGSLPAMNVSREDDSIRIAIRPALAIQLPVGVTVKLTVEVLDADLGAIDIMAVAFTGDDGAVDPGAPVAIFQGLYTADAIFPAIESCIYLMVDRAQLLGSAPPAAIDLGGPKVMES